MKPVTGKYQEAFAGFMSKLDYPMSFLSDKYNDAGEWQKEARAEVRRLLSYGHPETPMDVTISDEYVTDGLLYRHVSYAQAYGPRTEGYLIKPENASGKLPGVVALHDHSGFKYYGKEKLAAPKNQPEIMKEFQKGCYGGRAWAHELAKRGYVVFVPDCFLWGSRKIEVNDIP
jgi:hypothetical protein